MQKCSSVTDYINNHSKWKKSLELLQQLIDLTPLHENIKWGAPVYTLNNKNIIGLGAFKFYVGIWFYQGVFFKDEGKKLINAQVGKTKALRQWRFSSHQELIDDTENILDYINEAVENHNIGKAYKPQKKPTIQIPIELSEVFLNSDDLRQDYEKFSQYKQREFCEYIIEAKRKTTKFKRAEKVISMIKKGQGLNDKYR